MKRRKTREVRIGNLTIGGKNPIAIQSMTKTKTEDIEATLFQIKELEESGCELVRLALPTLSSAKALYKIKEKAKIPLIADVHFNYKIALHAIDSGCDKLRLNPGNIAEKDKVVEIARKARQYKIPIRVGANSGSVKDGETLVSSCLKEIKLLEEEGFFDIVVSIKGTELEETIASHTQMAELIDYPFHIGITEAGPMFSGSIKSAIGCGILLCEGFGDTIRVSLTAHPVEEVRVAKEILASLSLRHFGPEIISCPTCGRCKIDLFSIVNEVEERITGRTSLLAKKVAIMGCEVNGPKEAKRADFGLVGGLRCMVFRNGEIVGRIAEEDATKALLAEILK
ncbi:MAG: flavodoxin-dependent (E)-4-hydroxy-3-methylbut-2-enyl-diphosphate synthase [bacterium]|nr:flavodoxin-dependent (E)-4-hydroxy-3-methylbut-2-enyl-diphosphate synthase [bacterium]